MRVGSLHVPPIEGDRMHAAVGGSNDHASRSTTGLMHPAAPGLQGCAAALDEEHPAGALRCDDRGLVLNDFRAGRVDDKPARPGHGPTCDRPTGWASIRAVVV